MNAASNRLESYLRHPAARQATREHSVTNAFRELHEERKLFLDLVTIDGKPDDMDSEPRKVETRHPGHSMAPPTSRKAEWTGEPKSGLLVREEGIYLSTDREAPPTLNTITKTRIHPFGMEKVSATEGPDGVRVRRQMVDVEDLQYCYTDEYFIAR